MVRKIFALGTALVALLVLLWATGGVVAGPPPEGQEGEGEVEPQRDVGILAMLGTAFTYQGQLKEDGSPVNGTCDFQFKLCDAAGDATQVGSTQTKTNINVSNGLFTVQLDFGSDVFTGDARWLEVAVRCPAGGGSYTTLSPRQALTPAPYALALPGLWTQQNATSPNLIGGYSGNIVAAGVVGATIGGGGESGKANQVTADYGTVGGGYGNTASGYVATVAGGRNNTASTKSTVGGGEGNTANGISFIGGGVHNTAGDYASTVGGGWGNTTSDWYATIGGGMGNTTSGDFATIAGGGRSDPADPATGNRVTDDYGTVGGGGNNQAGDNAGTTDDATYATVAGGWSNEASDEYATVAGGFDNTASGNYTAIGGGDNNIASGSRATVGGGNSNIASGNYTTVSGGYNNEASSMYATVGGGNSNTASGIGAIVPGGHDNTAGGNYSFAAGRRAKSNYSGCFVWGDSTDDDIACHGPNRWMARASGGVWFYSNSGLTAGVWLPAGGSAWSAVSDRNAKENFAPVDRREVLERLAQIPITTWNYESQDPSIRHMGLIAQDFYAAFGLGEDDIHISTVDADGVALAAIQGLYQLSQEQAARIEELEAENTALQGRLDHLEARVATLEQRPEPVEGPVEGAGAISPMQAGLLPGAGVLLAGLALVWVSRRGGVLSLPQGGER